MATESDLGISVSDLRARAAAEMPQVRKDLDTRAHGANEGLHLAEFERVCLAEALLLAKLASLRR